VKQRTFLSEGYAARAQDREDLDRRYGEIGISAVAAAVRYQDRAKAAAGDRDDDQVGTKSAA
jgi:hypothetical protein